MGGRTLARVFINNCVQAHGFSLLPHRQEGHFGWTLLKAENDFQLGVPCLLTVSLK